ncbi:MAG: metallophosphoesterase [Bacillota bacterium]|nr:metallophosphoesterase [Bacillota bacterium]
MKILVFSDSHGYIENMNSAIKLNSDADMIIHLGDCTKDIFKVMDKHPGYRYEFVRGNNDWLPDIPAEKQLDICGMKILLTHGHQYGVKSGYGSLQKKCTALNYNAVFFGHTHMTEDIFSEGLLMINPGSISLPVYPAKPTYCTAEISKGKINVKFLPV